MRISFASGILFSVKGTSGMLMNFVVDDDHLMRLIEEARKLGQHRTQEETVETALKEYIHQTQMALKSSGADPSPSRQRKQRST